jgi:hypothetical protein
MGAREEEQDGRDYRADAVRQHDGSSSAKKKNLIPRPVLSDFYFRDGSTSLIRTIARLRARIWSGGFDYIASLSTGFQTSLQACYPSLLRPPPYL